MTATLIGLCLVYILSRVMGKHSTALAVIVAAPLGGVVSGVLVGTMTFILHDLTVAGRSADVSIVADLAVYGLLLGVAFGMPVTATFGLLIHRAFVRRGWTRFRSYLFTGTIGGFLLAAGQSTFAAVEASNPSQDPFSDMRILIPICTALTIAFSAGIFWVIRRPDRPQWGAVAQIFE